MPTRPPFWIHRTPRFWLGLALLLVLLAFWLAAGEVRSEIAIGRGDFAFNLTVQEGRVCLAWTEVKPAGSPPGWVRGSSFEYGDAVRGFKWLPGWEAHEKHYPAWGMEIRSRGLFLPLWPLPLLWALIWPLQLRRAEAREARLFANPGI